MGRRQNSSPFNVEQGVKYDYIDVKGGLQSLYDILAYAINIKGGIITDKDLIIDTYAKLKGHVNVHDISAQKIKIHGSISANRIVADNIKLVFGKDSSINKVEGSFVEIRNGGKPEDNEKIMNSILNLFDLKLTYKEDPSGFICKIGEITGESIELTDVTADIVQGDTIILHNNCNIKKLIYRNELIADEACIIQSKEHL